MLPQLEGKPLLFGTTASCGLGFMLFGYDQGVFGGLLSNPDFLRTFNNPGTTLQGQIVSTYTIGCIFGAILSLCIGDILGRRRSVALGCALVGVGGILQATAYTLPHMIIGRVIGGLGIGVNTTTIPMFQSETCKPTLRGKLVSVQLTFLVFGFVLTNWMNFGFTFIPNSPISWRFPLGFQSALAIGTVFLLPMLAESPRWLCLKDRQQEAEVVLSRLVAKPIDDPEVQDLLHVMVTTIARERADGEITWREVFHNGSQQTFRRILLGAGTSFMQQIGGVNIVAYYLPVVLERSFGFTPQLSLILSACDSMQWMFWAAMAYFVIERVGRFKLMLFGAAGCSMCFAVTGAGLGAGGKVGNGVAVAFIFLYYFFYGLSWLAIPFLYPSEINSNRSRNRGASIAMITNWVCVYIIVSVTPIGIETIQWRFYVIFAVLNLCWIPIVWFFYVETSGLSLEEIDRVFEIKHAPGAKISYKEAAKQAREEVGGQHVLQLGGKGNGLKGSGEESDFVERVA